MTTPKKKTPSEEWDFWERNWENARKFFESKGNMDTKSRLKDKWYNEYFADLSQTQQQTREEVVGLAKSMKQGSQGCVGFIEVETEYNQALQDLIQKLKERS